MNGISQEELERNYQMVRRMAVKMARKTGLESDDLFQEGCIGLIEAARKFDHQKGTRLSTYSAPRIYARMIDFLRDWSHFKRKDLLKKRETGEEPCRIHSLEQFSDDRAKRNQLVFREEDSRKRHVEDLFDRAMSKLQGREKEIIELYYLHELYGADIAAHFSVSRQKLSLEKSRILQFLREELVA